MAGQWHQSLFHALAGRLISSTLDDEKVLDKPEAPSSGGKAVTILNPTYTVHTMIRLLKTILPWAL